MFIFFKNMLNTIVVLQNLNHSFFSTSSTFEPTNLENIISILLFIFDCEPSSLWIEIVSNVNQFIEFGDVSLWQVIITWWWSNFGSKSKKNEFQNRKNTKKCCIVSYRCKLNCGITLLWSYLGFALIASIEDCSTLSCPFLAVISASRKDWRFFLAVISALRICCCSYICSSCFNDNFKISSLKFARSAWMALLLFSKQSYYKTRKRVIFTYVFCWFVFLARDIETFLLLYLYRFGDKGVMSVSSSCILKHHGNK